MNAGISIEQLAVAPHQQTIARGETLAITVTPMPATQAGILALPVRIVSAYGTVVFEGDVFAVGVGDNHFRLELAISDDYDEEVYSIHLGELQGCPLVALQIMVVDPARLQRMALFDQGLDKRLQGSKELERGDPRPAIDSWTQAALLYESAQELQSSAEVRLDIAGICLDIREFDDAEEHARRGLELYRKIEEWRGVDIAHQLLHSIGSAQHQRSIEFATARSTLVSEREDRIARATLTGRSPLFSGILPKDYARISAAARVREFQRGEILYREGDSIQQVLLLTSGFAKVTQLGLSGPEVILSFAVPGDVLGATGLSSTGRHSTTAEAFRLCRGLVWDAPVFKTLVERIPILSENMVRILGKDLLELEERFREVANETVEPRVARQLARLMQKMGRPVIGGVEIGISREDLSRMTGTTLFTVSRLLSKWEASGILKPRREAVTICDVQSLCNVSGFPEGSTFRTDPGLNFYDETLEPLGEPNQEAGQTPPTDEEHLRRKLF